MKNLFKRERLKKSIVPQLLLYNIFVKLSIVFKSKKNYLNRQIYIYVLKQSHPDEVSLAIGKGGMNIRLATQLTGYSIDVYRDIEEGEEDIYLDEFSDEIDGWVIEALKNLGLGTAKSVLNASRELLDQADLEDDTLEHVLEVLRAEFED